MTQPHSTDPFNQTSDLSPEHLQSLLVVADSQERGWHHARELGRRLNCEGETDASCRNCRLLAVGNFEDRLEISASTKQSLGIDDIRGLSKRISLSRTNLTKIKFVILNADQLTREAQNALLKLTEEPPPDTLMIFVSTKPMQLLPTIRSRARLVRLDGASQSDDTPEVNKWLTQRPFDRFISVKALAESLDVAQFLGALQRQVIQSVAQRPQQVSSSLAALEQARRYLAAGVSARVCLEYVSLEFQTWN